MNINDSPQPVVLLFAGQGNPQIGMGVDLWDINSLTRSIWDCASDISGKDIRQLCQQGPMNRLIQTTVQQLIVTAINITLYSLCCDRLENLHVIGACGHSVGEYSALYAAGIITLETLFRLIHFRAVLMHDLSMRHKGSMLVINGIDHPGLCALINSAGIDLDISCDNSRNQQVVGGATCALAEFTRVLHRAGYMPTKSGVSGAWHTRLMQEGYAPMRDYLADMAFFPSQYEVLMNVTDAAESGAQSIKECLALHLTHTVKWRDSIQRFLYRASPVLFLEISHKPWLCHLLKDYRDFNPRNVLHCRTTLTMQGEQV